MAHSIWRRCVPGDLLRTYQAWDEKYASGIPMVDCPAVGDILSSIREAGPLKRCRAARGTSKARVIPKIRCHGDLWDHRTMGQLRNMVPRGCLRYHMMHRVCQLILVWTTKSVVLSHCITWLHTQLILTVCQICCHGDLWDHRSMGQLRNMVQRDCLRYHMMHRVCQLILVWTRKSVVLSHCIT